MTTYPARYSEAVLTSVGDPPRLLRSVALKVVAAGTGAPGTGTPVVITDEAGTVLDAGGNVGTDSNGQLAFCYQVPAGSGEFDIYQGSTLLLGNVRGVLDARASALTGGFTVRSTTASTTAAAGELILADTTSNDITVTLPTSTSTTQIAVVKIAGAHTLTIQGQSGKTIDGQTTATAAAQWSSVLLGPDGSGGYVIVGGSPTGTGAILAEVLYNPGASTLTPITSTSLVDVDATHLLVTFTVPASGQVDVTLCASSYSPLSNNNIDWGLRNGSTEVAGSVAQIDYNVSANLIGGRRAHTFRVTGLTPGAALTWKWAAFVSGGTGYVAYGDDGTTTGRSGPALIRVIAA